MARTFEQLVTEDDAEIISVVHNLGSPDVGVRTLGEHGQRVGGLLAAIDVSEDEVEVVIVSRADGGQVHKLLVEDLLA